MPRYHIDVCTTFEKVPDRVGRELADIKEATNLAVRYIRLLSAKASYRHIEFRCLVIRNEWGRFVATLPFRSPAIKVPVPPQAVASTRVRVRPAPKPRDARADRSPRKRFTATPKETRFPR